MKDKTLFIKFFDVGLGDCILVCFGKKILLIDGGAWYSDALRLFMETNNIRYIDYVICTHAHADHVDGLADILGIVDFGVLYSNIDNFPKSKGFSKIKSIAQKKNKEIVIPKIGDIFYLGECKVCFLSPGCHSELISGNDRSLTCMLEYMEKKILMAADIGENVFDVWERENICIEADVFKVPHHGLEDIKEEYIDMISPEYSIISYGKNDYDVLNEHLLKKLNRACSGVFSTYWNGSVECFIDENSNLEIKYADDFIFGKKLLLLAANEETKKFVEKAHELNVEVIVTDHITDSPAKAIADRYYNINGKNTEEIIRHVKEERIDGVLVGVADPLVESYLNITKNLNFPCYISGDNIGFFTNKSEFKRICKEYGLCVVDEFYVGKDSDEALKKVEYFPCVIKPSKGRGGKGVSLCVSQEDFEGKFKIAKKYADDEVVIVEKYMNCCDVIANYYFVDGYAYLIAVSDRQTVKSKMSISPVTFANIYPSKLTKTFIDKCDLKFRKIFSDLKINNGILEMQIFWDGKNFFPYDPACILGGELSGPIFSKVFGIDLIDNFIKYALTGNMHCKTIPSDLGKVPGNRFAQSIWILLKPGKVGKVYGIDSIGKLQGVIGYLQRLREGDIVTDEMFETEKSAIARVWIVEENSIKLKELEYKVRNQISVYDLAGKNMVWEGDSNYV